MAKGENLLHYLGAIEHQLETVTELAASLFRTVEGYEEDMTVEEAQEVESKIRELTSAARGITEGAALVRECEARDEALDADEEEPEWCDTCDGPLVDGFCPDCILGGDGGF